MSTWVIAPSGFPVEDRFPVHVGPAPSPIEFRSAPGRVTAIEWLPLAGRVEGGVKTVVNGTPRELIDEAFDQTSHLQQGPSRSSWRASDLVGNLGVEKLAGVFLEPGAAGAGAPVGRPSASERRRPRDRRGRRARSSGLTAGGAVQRLQVGDQSLTRTFLGYDASRRELPRDDSCPGAAGGSGASRSVSIMEDYAATKTAIPSGERSRDDRRRDQSDAGSAACVCSASAGSLRSAAAWRTTAQAQEEPLVVT